MQRRFARLLRWVACAVVGLGVAAAAPTPDAELRDFSGTWVRDERASEDPLDKLEASAPAAPPRPEWGVSFPRRGGAGGGAGVRGAGRGSSLAPDRERALHLARGIEAWQVDHREPELVVRDANRETRVVFTDGRPLSDGIGTRTVASWRDDTLVIETRGGAGSRIESWRLEPDGARLAVITDVELGRGGRFTFRTVYDRVGPIDVTRSASEGAERTAGAAQEPNAPADETTAERPDRHVPHPERTSPPPDDGVPAPGGAAADMAAVPIPRASDWAIEGGTAIRLLPPPRPALGVESGRITIETLTLDPAVVSVEFFLDGAPVVRRAWAPFEAKVTLADPPREQVVRAVAFGADGRVLGEDELVVNRRESPLRVRIASIRRVPEGGLEVRAALTLPRRGELERVAFYLRDRLLLETVQPPWAVRIAAADVDPQDFIRVVAALRDGREVEDVALLAEGIFSAQVDVHLVQLQVLVTDRAGRAVAGLAAEDFQIVDDGEPREVARLYAAQRIPLLLGLSIDSSGSMWPLWEQARAAARYFLDATLGPRDRAFLVDFDSRLRLLEPATSDRSALAWALERLEPHGGTALYDSILFALLQYGGDAGRRALIVLTDGVDSESRSDPRRAIDIGRRLGVPIYVIAMSGAGGGPLAPGLRRSSASAAAASEEAAARNELRLVTDPTGGRLFHVITPEQVARAFAEIRDELGRQYVLTYYADRPPGDEVRPVVTVRRRGLEVRSAVPLALFDESAAPPHLGAEDGARRASWRTRSPFARGLLMTRTTLATWWRDEEERASGSSRSTHR